MFGQKSSAVRGEFSHIKATDVRSELQNGLAKFRYDKVAFRVYVFTYQQPFGPEHRMFLLAWVPSIGDEEKKGEQLIANVYKWAGELRLETWVFNGMSGGWRKDKEFFRSVEAANAVDLILPRDIMVSLQRDTTTFFDSQHIFKRLNIPWKRGILLLGPPGNGKTGTIKVLAKSCQDRGISVLYVQVAKSRSGPEAGITLIFQKARSEAPCLLILEDIETLVSGDTRTTMLNQLDGIEPNDGILIVATANDASQLDPAILQRPSRFDAKYAFDLPNAELRERFITHWLAQKLGWNHLRFDSIDEARSIPNAADLVALLVNETHGWSFAFLKELFVSYLLLHASKLSGRPQGASGPQETMLEPQFSVSDLLKHMDVLQKQVTIGLEISGLRQST
jgi:hypothetical protein